MIPYGHQEISAADIKAVAEALSEHLITQGPIVDRFEEILAATVGARYAVSFNSGTAALHAAYHAAGVGPRRSVLTSPITFVATANASLYLDGGVRFADVNRETVILDADTVQRGAAADVQVLAPVHFGGHVAPMEELASLARQNNWRLVEDAAHALGASYTTSDGIVHLVGGCHHSDMCCFSFHPVKLITTGEGGAVTTNDPDLNQSLRRFRSHGITRRPEDLKYNDGPWYYEQQELGYNYRLTDFQCALGISQLERLGDFVSRRRRIAQMYAEAFQSVQGVRPLVSPSNSAGAYHLYVVRVDSRIRRAVFEELRTSGIGVQVHYIPVYHQPFYRSRGFAKTLLPNTEAYYGEAISLPMFPALTDSQVEGIVKAVEVSVQRAVQNS